MPRHLLVTLSFVAGEHDHLALVAGQIRYRLLGVAQLQRGFNVVTAAGLASTSSIGTRFLLAPNGERCRHAGCA
jgi:hypothetical protein